MLLYEAPTGMAVFSFDEAYLNTSLKVLVFSVMLPRSVFVTNEEFKIM
jgi:hypothetical protein